MSEQEIKQKGMERSAVILANATVTLQFKRIARETGIDAWERYVDASSVPDFETAAVDWITKGAFQESALSGA